MYHGQSINNIANYSVKLYILCDKTTGEPGFEHVRGCVDDSNGLYIGGQYHFYFKTPLAC